MVFWAAFLWSFGLLAPITVFYGLFACPRLRFSRRNYGLLGLVQGFVPKFTVRSSPSSWDIRELWSFPGFCGIK